MELVVRRQGQPAREALGKPDGAGLRDVILDAGSERVIDRDRLADGRRLERRRIRRARSSARTRRCSSHVSCDRALNLNDPPALVPKAFAICVCSVVK